MKFKTEKKSIRFSCPKKKCPNERKYFKPTKNYNSNL